MVIPTDQRDPITRTLGSGQKRLGTETRDFGDTVDARPPAASPPPLADDVLRGAAAIAEFLYRTGARAQSSVLASRRCFVRLLSARALAAHNRKCSKAEMAAGVRRRSPYAVWQR
jgi:hypothetical protein